jgi:hypothetical protein
MAVPSPPSALLATTRNNQVTLTWVSPVGNPTGYNVKWSFTSGGPYQLLVTNVQTTFYTDLGLANGGTYFYVVTALNAQGESLPSNEVASTLPAVTYFYVTEHAPVDRLRETINFWNGSPYQLKFIFNPNSSNETESGQCYCVWEKQVIPLGT